MAWAALRMQENGILRALNFKFPWGSMPSNPPSLVGANHSCKILDPFLSWLKNSSAPLFFNPLVGVWISDETLLVVFDILRKKPSKTNVISHWTCSMVICCFPLGFKALLEKQIRRKHKLFKVDTKCWQVLSRWETNSKCPGQQSPDSTE